MNSGSNIEDLRESVERRISVYIIDDEIMVRSTIRKGLEKYGFVCMEFSGAKDFIEGLTHGLPDCVLLDLRMPVMDGMEVLEAIRANDVEFPIIMLTSHADYDKAVSSIKLGATDFLEKPCDFSVMSEKIILAINEKRRKNESMSKAEIARHTLSILPQTEKQVASLILEGKSHSHIANELGLSQVRFEQSLNVLKSSMKVETFPDLVRILRIVS